jgi:hypothetical protein
VYALARAAARHINPFWSARQPDYTPCLAAYPPLVPKGQIEQHLAAVRLRLDNLFIK